jgi:DNA-binding MarR family transcriptional regulator
MDEFIKSIKATLYDRSSSPLFGAFCISWGIWNYKFILILVSSMETLEKINFISLVLYATPYECLLNGFLYPLTTALIFIFGYPYPAKYVYEFAYSKQKELKEIKQKIEDETPLTREEWRVIRKEMTEFQIEYEKNLQRKDSEIVRLKELIDEYQKPQVPSMIEPVEVGAQYDSYNDITSEQLKLLSLVAKYDDPYEDLLIGRVGLSPIRTKYNLGELQRKGFIAIDYSDGDALYELTHKGREILVKNELDAETDKEAILNDKSHNSP